MQDATPPGSTHRSNVVLIGMPGSGKSTIGVLLAKRTCRDYVDTDVAIQSSRQQSLQRIVDEQGYLALRQIEEQVICSTEFHDQVIATGGSAVYSPIAMEHLRHNGVLVYLAAALETLQRRVQDYSQRGLAGPPGQTLRQLYEERLPLYERYADITIGCDGLDTEAVVNQLLAKLPDEG